MKDMALPQDCADAVLLFVAFSSREASLLWGSSWESKLTLISMCLRRRPQHRLTGVTAPWTWAQSRMCTSKIPQLWPNSQERLTSLRLFKAWDKNWGEQFRNESWKQLVDVVHRNGMKVLMGTQVSCDEDDDDSDWRLVLQLLKMLGRDHVMGVAVGNEMELLQFKEFITKECLDRIWKAGYFYKKLIARASDLDKIGFSDVPLTTVFGGYALAGEPFVESPTAMCYSFLTDAYKRFGRRWVFTLNIYPYFDPGNALDPGSTDKCSQSLKRDWCLDKTCNLPATTVVMRQKMEKLTGNSDDTLWLGETGWSYPQAASLSGANPQMAACAEFSSETAFRNYYSNFLHWDLSIGAGVKGPDHVFYFTLRDALNFGVGEHFGLIPDCDSQQCKLQENLTELGSSGAADASYEEMTRHSPEGEVTLV
eukprot:TRINITY_DN8621_c0_g1_i4.p1 TRINITY_DN8621_c0_g1~~TRINITY_DN8621_c0_g1_i4.p1  ORF type:complete len:423 (+),score=81.42 TRINITY_DN8621_c0_g1_i4:126-1394(+)